MSKTVIVCNPMGTDVTMFMSTLLRGSILGDGDIVYTLPYTNQPGRANVQEGRDLLETKLANTGGNVLVFAYSEGCQVADWWITDHGQDEPDPERMSFLMIGNPGRKYGGFITGHPEFDPVGWTDGRPDDVAFKVTDLARQYDGVADFPAAQPLQDAMASVGAATTDANYATDALQRVAGLMTGEERLWYAAMNTVMGMTLVHDLYFNVAVDDPQNVTLVEGNCTYVWSPTYPVPLLGIGNTSPQEDKRFRALVESTYDRPVTIPMPDYPHTSWFNLQVPWSKPLVTGWWAEQSSEVTVSTVVLVVSAPVPEVVAQRSATATVPAAVLVVSTPVPVVEAVVGAVALAPAAVLVVVAPTPAVSAGSGAVVTVPAAAALVVSAPAPVVASEQHAEVAVPAAVLVVTTPVPGVLVGGAAEAVAPAAVLVVTASVPVVVAGVAAEVNIPAAVVRVDAPVPAVEAGSGGGDAPGGLFPSAELFPSESLFPSAGGGSEPFTPVLVSVTDPGLYVVEWPAGATRCDYALCGAGGGGGGGLTSWFAGDGADTTATVEGQLYAAVGGAGGANSVGTKIFDGGSPGDVTVNGRQYVGGVGGASPAAYPLPGEGGSVPGAGGGGGFASSSRHGDGGLAGEWVTGAGARGAGDAITGSVGAGGEGGAPRTPSKNSRGGDGGAGVAHFYFYTGD